MNEQTRVKALGGVLVLLVGWFLLAPAIDSAFFEPKRELQRDLDRETSNVDLTNAKRMDLLRKKATLKKWQSRSLPPNPLIAHAAYQSWIYDLAAASGLTYLEVEPARRDSKRGIYTRCIVELEAEAKMQELATFLERFERADLLHRISRMSVESTDPGQSNALFSVSITAEGLSLPDAPESDLLFPRSDLTEEVDASTTKLGLASVDGFPKEPGFLIRSGGEFMKVTEIQDTSLTVERGVDGSKSSSHGTSEFVELFPIHPDAPTDDNKYATLVSPGMTAPPAKARVYKPYLRVSDQIAIRGREMSMEPRLADFDPKFGDPIYAINDGMLTGMEIDANSGEVTFTATEEVENGEYDVTVTVTASGNPGFKLDEDFEVTVRDPNDPPELKIATDHRIFINRPNRIPLEIVDDGDLDDIEIELDGDVPDGARIENSSRTFVWTPPESTEPGDYELTIRVTDDGDPSESDEVELRFSVMDDAAQSTHIVSITGVDEDYQAILYNKRSGDRHYIKVGSRLEVADIDAEVVEIQRLAVKLRTSDGVWSVGIGDALREMEQIETVDSNPEPAASDTNEQS